MELTGLVDKISYESPDNSFAVIRLREKRTKDPFVAVGPLAGLSVGQCVKLIGNWETHPKYGLRFRAEGYVPEAPSLPEDIERYLGSGAVKGIGPVTAKRIVERFGEKSLEVMEQEPDLLLQVKGISPRRLRGILDSWEAQKDLKELLLFLKRFDLPTGLAFKLKKYYKEAALSIITQDPYRLAMEVSGIGFLRADAIAKKLGHAKDSPSRFKAGLVYLLKTKTEKGHTYYPEDLLLGEATRLLEVDGPLLKRALEELSIRGELVIRASETEGRRIYLKSLYLAESYVGQRIRLMCELDQKSGLLPFRQMAPLKETPQALSQITLNEEQLQGVNSLFERRLLLITGGPGTGKTTLIRAMVLRLKEMGQKFYLTAPTGRAAKRMSELSGEEAKTVHRLLGWNPETGTFLHNERNPLRCNVIIVDEASMLDIVLFSHLLRALPETTRLVLVGDKDQLPPVGPGSPFMELVEDHRIRSIRLTKVYRQKEEGLLILNAHRIKEGLFPVLRERGSKDFLFIHEEDPNRAYNWAIELLTKRIPEEYNLDPLEEIQLLSPMRKGLLGVESLTFGVQEALKGRLLPMDSFLGYRVGDKVMQLRNDYEKDVYNGDIGRVASIEEEGRVRVSFYGREVSYDMADLDDLSLAYCISVHKSQGSEYPAVILTLSTSHFPLLQRNLLYTAITRAKRLAVIVGTKKALAMAIRNDKPFQRYTALSSWL